MAFTLRLHTLILPHYHTTLPGYAFPVPGYAFRVTVAPFAAYTRHTIPPHATCRFGLLPLDTTLPWLTDLPHSRYSPIPHISAL